RFPVIFFTLKISCRAPRIPGASTLRFCRQGTRHMLHHVIHLSPCLTGTSLAAPGPPPPSAPEKPMNCFHQVFEQIRDSPETTSPHSLKQTCQPSPNARKPSSLAPRHFPEPAFERFFGDYFCSGCLSFADSGELEDLNKTKKAGFPRPFRHTTKFEQNFFGRRT